MTTTNNRSYYCSLKFDTLSVNLDHRSLYSCCSATPASANLDDIRTNGLINNLITVKERQMMLDNERVSSCESYCWSLEDKNLISGRLQYKTNNKIYFHPKVHKLTKLNIILGSRCNLTCAYCCKYYSRAWLADIKQNGNYNLDLSQDRFTYGRKDKIIDLIPQSKLNESNLRNKLIEEIYLTKADIFDISGGEPLLYEEDILNIIKNADKKTKINIYTGAGLPVKKFSKIIEKFSKFSNISIIISAETIGKFYEFNRYGVGHSYKNFLENVNVVKNNLPYGFASTLSNTTIFGFNDFVNYFGFDKIHTKTLCLDPSFLQMIVIDDESREKLIALYSKNTDLYFIVDHLRQDFAVTLQDKKNLQSFIKEFCLRRNLAVDIFPKSFINWMNTHI